MDPHVVFDCRKVLPDTFALTLAAVARARALRHGAEPRLEIDSAGVGDLALKEIAAGVFSQDELSPFLPGASERPSLPPPGSGAELCGRGSARADAAPASQ